MKEEEEEENGTREEERCCFPVIFPGGPVSLLCGRLRIEREGGRKGGREGGRKGGREGGREEGREGERMRLSEPRSLTDEIPHFRPAMLASCCTGSGMGGGGRGLESVAEGGLDIVTERRALAAML